MPIVLPNNLDKEPLELVNKITYKHLKKALEEVAKEKNMPVQIADDKYDVNDGGLFSSLITGTKPCVAVYHTKHKKDYHCAIIELKEAYGSYYVYVHMGGISKNQRDINWGKSRAYVRSDGGFGLHHPGLLARLDSIAAKADMQDENLYYDALYKLIGEAIVEAQVMADLPPRTTSAPRPENTQKTSNHTAAQQEAPKKEVPKAAQAAPAPEKPIQPEPHKEPATAEPRQKLEKSIGIETMGGVFTKIISAGTYIPTEAKMTFSTAADKQTSVEINVLQGENEKACDNVSLGKYMLSGIAPARRGVPQIEVTFSVNKYGELDLTAVDKGTKNELEIFVDNILATKKEAEAQQPDQPKQQQEPDQHTTIPSANCCISIDKSDEEFLFWTTAHVGFLTNDRNYTEAIRKNCFIPHSKYINLYVPMEEQNSASFQVVESAGSLQEQNKIIGKFVLSDVASSEKEQLLLELCCCINPKGIMNVTAKDVSANTYLSIAFAPVEAKDPERTTTKSETKSKSKVEQLQDLVDLLDRGALTQKEFEILKKKILYN